MATMELTLSLVLVLLVCLIVRLLLAAAQRKLRPSSGSSMRTRRSFAFHPRKNSGRHRQSWTKNNKHAETFNAMNHLHFGVNLSVR